MPATPSPTPWTRVRRRASEFSDSEALLNYAARTKDPQRYPFSGGRRFRYRLSSRARSRLGAVGEQWHNSPPYDRVLLHQIRQPQKPGRLEQAGRSETSGRVRVVAQGESRADWSRPRYRTSCHLRRVRVLSGRSESWCPAIPSAGLMGPARVEGQVRGIMTEKRKRLEDLRVRIVRELYLDEWRDV